MPLQSEAAWRAIADSLAVPLGFNDTAGVDETAQGIITLGATIMAGAIKQITIERGLDPREFALFAFGGGGPLHAAALARELNIPEVVIPPEPGNFSALGMILADARIDEAQTFLRPLSTENILEVRAVFKQMEERMLEALSRDFDARQIGFEHEAEMRFRGQKHSTRIAIDGTAEEHQIREVFQATYRRRYGHVDPDGPIEFVSLVLTAVARMGRPNLRQLLPAVHALGLPQSEARAVYVAERGRRIDTRVYRRRELPAGFMAGGPAIIEEYGSTTVVGPDDHFAIGELGEIRLRFS